jgi:general secretion pathway protein D
MKTTTLVLILFLTGIDLWAQTPPPSLVTNMPGAMRLPGRFRTTNSPAFDMAARLAAMRSNSAAMTRPAMPAPVPAVPAAPAPAVAPSDAQADANAPVSANSNGGTNEVAAYQYDFQGVDVKQVLQIYSDLVGRTLLMAQPPTASIILKTQSPLTRSEAIEAFQAVLALNNIELIPIGDKFLKVLPPDQAGGSGAKIDTSDANQLPDLGPYVTHIVHLNYVKASSMQQILTPFAKLAGSITPLDDNGILILRDHAENVKRMLELIDQVDTGGGESEIISEVIPIKYALAADIASALNSLGGGSGGGTVSIGTAATTSTINGIGSRPAGSPITPGGGTSYQPGGNGIQGGIQPRAFGTTANGTPATGTTFQQRLLSIVNKASGANGQDQPIQIFGQTKIIADQRSNSLLIFATRQDMDAITNVIAKLDVLLSQVLIESAIIDVDLNKGMNTGVSVAQGPSKLSPGGSVIGGGGSVNGPTFINLLNSTYTSSANSNSTSIFGNALSSGLSYFGNIGPTWDVALQAAANDSSASVIQRPRIQTSQAKAASFFVGQTVPYVTGTTYGSAYGNSSSYSQLSVGVELDVTPFINPDGLVVMDINQEIDDLNGYTVINNVGNVPNTTKRTLQSEIAVKDKDTIMLGGFIRSDKSDSKSGVPYLEDIPLIGALFSQRSSTKDRQETIVLIRPTVLRTPELAAAQAVSEQKRLPGISAAVNEDIRDERKQIESEANSEAKDAAADAAAAQKRAESGADNSRGVFLPVAPDGTVLTNSPANP